MSCCHHYHPDPGCDAAFAVDVSAITFGRGCMRELGPQAHRLGLRRVAVFTDPRVRELPPMRGALASLAAAGIGFEVFDEVRIEPTDRSFAAAIAFAREARVDGYVSVGGGSVIDTAKAANLYATHPAAFDTYVNAPVGAGQPVPGPLRPHIACPTTSGTGSECTGIAIFDDLSLHAKTGIASRRLRLDLALIDPDWTRHLPRMVLACSAFDVLSHALESLTARPHTRRPHEPGAERPLSQGANPWSDMGCARSLELLGKYMLRAIDDAADDEAREQVMWASTLAGIAFGNSGVHLPHGMAYAVAGNVRDYRPPDYPRTEPMVPHGMSVILNAPAVFAETASTSPQRHLDGARWLGADVAEAAEADAGEIVGTRLIELMQAAGLPQGLAGLGYAASDIGRLTEGAAVQRRLLDNAPVAVDDALLNHLFSQSLCY
ncbi:hydroxyacid-oxoacid transhydrogenase [Elongatibacter sediminis]|uniref:hydroxyacid-oxoacid transhydrogenase n=1 Tax=Elongatibacter sediminis TaxID=3119006 RepID=A0AAW9REF4_9GAMM